MILKYFFFTIMRFCLFTLLTVSFGTQNVKFSWSQIFVFFLLLPLLLISYQRNYCQVQCHEAFVLSFLLNFFIVLILQLGPWFICNFVYAVMYGSSLILLHVVIQFSQHHLLKGNISTFVKNHFPVYVSLFLSTLFYSVILCL